MDISQITDHLYVGAEPESTDAPEIAARNVRLIISMRGECLPPKPFREPPFEFLWLRSYDTFITPVARPHLLRGIKAARKVAMEGARALVYCQRGRHRSVIMGAAILIANGLSATEAMDLIRTRRPVADPDTWYVRRQIHRFERCWRVLPHDDTPAIANL